MAGMSARTVAACALVALCVVLGGAAFAYYLTMVDESPEEYVARIARSGEVVSRLQEDLPQKIQEQGAAFALRAVFAAARSRSISSGECHLLLHNVGHATFAAASMDSLRDAFTFAEVRTCLGGYLHGMEAEILESGQEVQVRAWKLCELSHTIGVKNGPCFHGFGHAALEWTQDVDEAITLCDSLSGGPEEDMSGCYRGIFSQLSDYIAGKERSDVHFPAVDPRNTFAYCRTLRSDVYYACLTQLSQRYNDVGDAHKGFGACMAASVVPIERKVCAQILTALETRKAYDENREASLSAFFAVIPVALHGDALSGMYESYRAAKDTYPEIRSWEVVCREVAQQPEDRCRDAAAPQLQEV